MSALQQVAAGVGRAVPASGVVGVVTVGLTVWHALMPSIDEVFAMIPHHTVISPTPYCPFPFCWNMLTAHLFEANLFKGAISLPCVFLLTRLLERLWSLQAIALHVVVATASAGAVFFVSEVMRIHRTEIEHDFFMPTRGCVGLLVALAVGVRQAHPFEALPFLPKAWGWQCQHLPFAVTGLAMGFGLVTPAEWMPEWPFAPFALFFAWLHVRYMMWFPYAEEYGDHSSEFEFASLFPRALQPVVAFAGTLFYGLVLVCASDTFKLRESDNSLSGAIMYDPTKAAQASGLPFSNVNGGEAGDGSSGRSREYDVRRAKALELLDANIASLLAPSGAAPLTAVGGGSPRGLQLGADSRTRLTDDSAGMELSPSAYQGGSEIARGGAAELGLSPDSGERLEPGKDL